MTLEAVSREGNDFAMTSLPQLDILHVFSCATASHDGRAGLSCVFVISTGQVVLAQMRAGRWR